MHQGSDSKKFRTVYKMCTHFSLILNSNTRGRVMLRRTSILFNNNNKILEGESTRALIRRISERSSVKTVQLLYFHLELYYRV